MPRRLAPAMLALLVVLVASPFAGTSVAGARSGRRGVGDVVPLMKVVVPTDCTQTGTEGGDVLEGTSGTDVLCGLGGDDVLMPNGGSDVVVGGPGTDIVSYAGTTSSVTVDLAGWTAAITDAVTELRSVEGVWGSAAADTLLGNARSNLFAGLAGRDAIDGRGGIDTVDYSVCRGAGCQQHGVTIDLSKHTARGIGFGTDQLRRVENVYGSLRGGDRITGNGAPNWLYGFGGADILRGLAGNDYLSGADGDDRLDGGAGDDFLDGNLGTDGCVGGSGIDALVGCP